MLSGLYYVASTTLEYNRTALINAKLWRDGSVYRANKARSAKRASDVDLVRRSVAAHEELHSQLAKEELERLRAAGNDPVTNIEKLVEVNGTRLRALANSAILDSSDKLAAASSDMRVKQRMRRKWAVPARIYLPTGDGYVLWSTNSLADVGFE